MFIAIFFIGVKLIEVNILNVLTAIFGRVICDKGRAQKSWQKKQPLPFNVKWA